MSVVHLFILVFFIKFSIPVPCHDSENIHKISMPHLLMCYPSNILLTNKTSVVVAVVVNRGTSRVISCRCHTIFSGVFNKWLWVWNYTYILVERYCCYFKTIFLFNFFVIIIVVDLYTQLSHLLYSMRWPSKKHFMDCQNCNQFCLI